MASKKRVTLYGSKNCPHCKTAKQYLDDNNISYRYCDVGNPRGSKELAALGLRAVPVLKVGDSVLNGFSVQQFKKLFR